MDAQPAICGLISKLFDCLNLNLNYTHYVGLVESNGSLPLGDDLKSHMWADFLYTGISSGPNAW